MSAISPSSVHRRIQWQWAECIKSLKQIHDQIVVAAERPLQHAFYNEGSLIPVPVRTIVNRRRPRQSRSRD